MAGIIGYSGDQPAADILVAGMRRIEYRGYDSAGIATLENGKLFLCRVAGSIDTLVEEMKREPLPGNLGIGHLRWATHGVPCRVNAHPHTDTADRIAIVHNGMLENYAALLSRLRKKNILLRSETDSEIIAQLIAGYLREGAETLEQAVHCALMDIKGAYAIAVIDREAPDKIIAARNGSPLLIGLAGKELFVSSDPSAIVSYTRNVIFLEDYQMAVIRRAGVTLTNLTGTVIEKIASVIDWDVEEAQKEGYRHFMLKEIHEQPAMIKNIIARKLDFHTVALTPEDAEIIRAKFATASQIMIQACGSSYHAGLIARHWFEYFANMHVDVDVASEFRYKQLPVTPGGLLLTITQSGETADALAALRKAKQKGLASLTVCNVVGSSMSRESQATWYTHAGPELGVASTKTYTAQLINLYIIAVFLGLIKKVIKPQFKDRLLKDATFIPSLLKKALAEEAPIEHIAAKYAGVDNMFLLGNGINYASALEGAHKLREVAGIHASAYPAGEVKHGPMALISERMLCICLIPQSQTYDKMFSTIQKIKARSGKVVAIATSGDDDIAACVDDVIWMPAGHECFSPILAAIPLQLFAYYLAVRRGYEIDRPKHLAKSVLVE